MKKPKKPKPRLKATIPPALARVQLAPQTQAQLTNRTTSVITGGASIIAVATIIGGLAAIGFFWPRVTVEVAGDLSKPASVEFVATNTGFTSLGFPTMGMWDCEITYGKEEPSSPMSPCRVSSFPDEGIVSEGGQRWLLMDKKFITRLEDWITVTVKEHPITRMNVLIRMSYYPWYIPLRLHRVFGFQSAKGSDGVYYWRPYDPQS
jgi:hypothetical protein